MKFSIIAAIDEKMGIGKNGRLPWNLPTDLKFFHDKTTGRGKNAVIMGRLTWESIPENRRPLKDRINIVITRNSVYELPVGVEKAVSLEEALKIAHAKNVKVAPTSRRRVNEVASLRLGLEEIYVIGGAQIFYDAVQHPSCETLYITKVKGDFGCDTFFPKIDPQKFKKTRESEAHEENSIKFRFVHYSQSLSLMV